jgi:hypothetical protein
MAELAAFTLQWNDRIRNIHRDTKGGRLARAASVLRTAFDVDHCTLPLFERILLI